MHPSSPDSDAVRQPPVDAEPSAPDPVVTFVVLAAAGDLSEHQVDGTAVEDEWSHYQDTLWTAVHDLVDPGREDKRVNGIELEHRMRAKTAEVVGEQAALYPPNAVATPMLTRLGAPERPWSGAIVIVAEENEEGLTGSLTGEQLDLIRTVHQQALRDLGPQL